MKKTNLLIIFFYFWIVSLGSNVILAKEKFLRVHLILGEVLVKSKSSLKKLKQSDLIRDGAILNLKKRSYLEIFSSKSNINLKIKGPKIFRISFESLSKSVNQGNYIYNLYRKISRNFNHYQPATVVLGARELNVKEKETQKQDKRKIRKSLKGIIRIFKNNEPGMLGKAHAELIELKKIKGLNRHTKMLIEFYTAEIYFQRMDFNKALNIYKKLYKTRLRNFDHKEKALVRAILCCYFTDNHSYKNALISQYFQKYKSTGKFSKMLRDFN